MSVVGRAVLPRERWLQAERITEGVVDFLSMTIRLG
jgi:hypothetical protein